MRWSVHSLRCNLWVQCIHILITYTGYPVLPRARLFKIEIDMTGQCSHQKHAALLLSQGGWTIFVCGIIMFQTNYTFLPWNFVTQTLSAFTNIATGGKEKEKGRNYTPLTKQTPECIFNCKNQLILNLARFIGTAGIFHCQLHSSSKKKKKRSDNKFFLGEEIKDL